LHIRSDCGLVHDFMHARRSPKQQHRAASPRALDRLLSIVPQSHSCFQKNKQLTCISKNIKALRERGKQWEGRSSKRIDAAAQANGGEEGLQVSSLLNSFSK
jgi:hypothetical protein